MKRKLLFAIPLLCLVGIVAWFFRPKHETIGEAYISERSVTLWSGVAQVREPIDVLHYGDHVELIARRNDNVKVRTSNNILGWIDARNLMEPALWQRSATLLVKVKAMPVQSRGRTKVATNLRVEPGRNEHRLYQFGRGIPVEIVGRAVADWAQTADEKEAASESQDTRKEEWFLVRGLATRPPGENAARSAATNTTTQPGDQTIPIAGWVIARFIELDLPDPVREGAASSNIRPIAWFELNKASDPSGDKSQYLLAAARGPEGQVCDFTTLRVYTWNTRKTRYETAFIENDLCGKLPIRVLKSPKNEPEFRFRVMDGQGEERVYRLMQTVVRRIKESEPSAKKSTPSPAKHGKK